MPKLAIVIPAYKAVYFQKTLESLAWQSCQDFTLYIGDDSSPNDIKSIVALFENKINIVYTRFDNNLGNKNLVAHWERCIDLVKDEEWIWLFSDDDIMDKNCIEKFYQVVSDYPNFDLYHFDVQIINHKGDITNSFKFPDLLSSEEFFLGRCQSIYYSYVVEYIFRRSHFLEMGRFPNFDLAWGSDDALWIKLGKRFGIKTISNAKVFWRSSQYNISPNDKDKEMLRRKFYATIQYGQWALQQSKSDNLEIDFIQMQKILEKTFFKKLKISCENLSFKMIKEFSFRFYKLCNINPPVKIKILNVYFYKIYRYSINIFKNSLPSKLKLKEGFAA